MLPPPTGILLLFQRTTASLSKYPSRTNINLHLGHCSFIVAKNVCFFPFSLCHSRWNACKSWLPPAVNWTKEEEKDTVTSKLLPQCVATTAVQNHAEDIL